MALRETQKHRARKLEVYKLHAQLGATPADYDALLRKIRSSAPEKRYLERDDRLIALSEFAQRENAYWIIAFEGPIGENPIIFDSKNSTSRIQRLQRGEVVAQKTHALIDAKTREAIVEYNHRGAKASDIAEIFEQIGRTISGWETLSVELNPVPDGNFVRSVERFERIRSATLKIAKPNPGWTDAANVLTEVADVSNARTAEMTANANPGDGLAKRDGIVRYIIDMANSGVATLKGAKITGHRPGEEGETSVSLASNIEHQRIAAKKGDDGHIDDEDMLTKMRAFMNSRRRQHG